MAVRLALRRRRAAVRREPIAILADRSGAGGKPPGWPGWPEGKQFAFVLTHDVEGSKGLSRVPRLMDLEVRHGFRSSFNFVPEGEYAVSAGFTRKAIREGFEIGAHGLEHDGKLYAFKAGVCRQGEAHQRISAAMGCVRISLATDAA